MDHRTEEQHTAHNTNETGMNLAADVQLSDDQINGLCYMINNKTTRSDVPAQHDPFEPRMTHRRSVPPLAQSLKHRKTLPVFPYKRTILQALCQQRVLLISGGTGCDKTTQVPQFLMEEATSQGTPCKIICTQPRRLATTSIAKRIAQERCENLPGAVGYQVRMDSCMKSTSSLIFMTR